MIEWLLDKGLQLIGFAVKKGHKNYLWQPDSALRNTKKCTVIDNYPKTIAMVNGDFSSDYISGAEAFAQAVRFFILTKRRTYPIYSDDYGIEEADTIFEEKNVVEFQRQCRNIALHLMEYFDEWIEEIYRIHRKKNELTIELKVSGKADTLAIKIESLNK